MSALRTTAKALSVILALSAGPTAAATQQTCGSFKFPVYFAASSTTLTPAADRVIGSAGERMRPCTVEKIVISIRDKPDEARLDRARAAAVSAALSQAGATAASVVTKRQARFQMFRRRVVVLAKMSPP